ncbi:trypsin [Aphomia sociella]
MQVNIVEQKLVSCNSYNHLKEEDDYISEENSEESDFNEMDNEVFNNTSSIKTERRNFNAESSEKEVGIITDNDTYDCQEKEEQDKEGDDSCKTTVVYPFTVSLQKKGSHYASGALVDKRWILTAAGGFYNVRESIKLFRARLGSVNSKEGGSFVPLKAVEIHPSYVLGKPSFDLALLRIATPVDYTDYIRPIRLSQIKHKVLSAKFLITYWPRLIVNGQSLPSTAKERIKHNSMRVSTQRLIPWDECRQLMNRGSEVLKNSSLCLRPIVTHHSSCMPDVGAPVVAKDGLWGITSGWTSKYCNVHPSPTIFTRLSSSSVRSWLDPLLINV